MLNYEHNAPSVSTENSKKENVIGISAQGQGEQVLFFFFLGFEAANEPATVRQLPWTNGEHFWFTILRYAKKKKSYKY